MSTTAKIGAFFLVVLGLAAFLIMKIEDIPIGKRARTRSVDVRFKDVAGLDDKSMVRIAGVPVGKVDGIRLLHDGTAVVHLALDPDVELREGAYGQIQSLGLLGDKYVLLSPGDPKGTRLGDGKQIEGTSRRSPSRSPARSGARRGRRRSTGSSTTSGSWRRRSGRWSRRTGRTSTARWRT
jgi:phospholipid/cholesterol/gamma-HCH transport system substrate-binding protein